jgi:hypothetical protein
LYSSCIAGPDVVQQFVFVLVVFVLAVGNHRRRRRDRHESLNHLHFLQGGLEVVDVALERGLPGVGDRADHHRLGRDLHVVPRVELLVKLREAGAVRAAYERVSRCAERTALEAAHALDDVLRPGNALAELAVADHVDSRLGLPAHHVGHLFLQAAGVSLGVVALALLLCAQKLPDGVRPDQAADMGGEYPIGAALHDACIPPWP